MLASDDDAASSTRLDAGGRASSLRELVELLGRMVLASPTVASSGGRTVEETDALRSLLVRLLLADLSASLDSLSSKAPRDRFFRSPAAWLTVLDVSWSLSPACVPRSPVGSSAVDVLADDAVRSFGGAGRTAELRRRLWRSVSCAD